MESLQEELPGEDLDATCATIITRTNDGGGPDNCTIVLLRVDPDDVGVA